MTLSSLSAQDCFYVFLLACVVGFALALIIWDEYLARTRGE